MKAMKTQLLATTLSFSYLLGISCRICDQLYSYKEAKKCCKDEKSSIITINNSTELDKLTSKMTNANLMSTWVPIIRHGLDGFHWIEMNGRISPALSNKPPTNKSCGLYDKKTNDIKAEHCSSSIGHICEIQNCTDCRTLGWDSVVCQQAETSCLIFSCDNKNWYDARLTCRQKGQRLAVATSEPVKIALSRGEYACDYFWIGVRSTEWGPNKGEPQPGIPLWDVNEPSDDGNCSALFVAGDSHKLRAGQCKKKRHVICGHIHSQIGNLKGEKEKEKQTSNLALSVGLPTAGAVLLIVIVVVVVIMARLKSKRKKSEKIGTEAGGPLLDNKEVSIKQVEVRDNILSDSEDTPEAGYNKVPTLGKIEGNKHGEASEELTEYRQTGKGATLTPQRRDKAEEAKERTSDNTAGDNTVSAPGNEEGYKQGEASKEMKINDKTENVEIVETSGPDQNSMDKTAAEELNENSRTGKDATSTPQRRDKAEEAKEQASESTAEDNTVSAPGKKEGYKQGEASKGMKINDKTENVEIVETSGLDQNSMDKTAAVDSEFPKEGTVKEKMAIFKQLESNKIRGSQAANGS